MENTEPTINASYRFHSRLKGEVELQIFNDFYLSVKEHPLKKRRQFKMEIATLNPQAVKKEDLAIHWLVAAVIAGLGGVFFIYNLFTDNERLMPLFGILISVSVSAAFIALFFYQSERKWIVETRNALYPLVVVPYRKSQQKEVQTFIDTLQQAIERNVVSKRYNSEDLFVGELRMLRRLTNHKVLSNTLYGQAKAHMMKSHGTATAA